MKNLMNILFWALLMGITVSGLNFANAEPVPEYMKGATITVKTKDGKEYNFSGEEYKVVKRGVVLEKNETTNHPEMTKNAPEEVNKNILSLEIMQGQHGQTVTDNSLETVVKTKRKLGFGLQYQRNVMQNYYLGVRVDTLGNFGGLIGLGF